MADDVAKKSEMRSAERREIAAPDAGCPKKADRDRNDI